MFRKDSVVIGNQYRPFYNVLQLPHITGPVVSRQHFIGGIVNKFNILAYFSGISLHEMLRKNYYILLALPQWRQHQRHNIYPEEEILSERAVPNRLVYLLVCCCNE